MLSYLLSSVWVRTFPDKKPELERIFSFQVRLCQRKSPPCCDIESRLKEGEFLLGPKKFRANPEFRPLDYSLLVFKEQIGQEILTNYILYTKYHIS
jgi:hypothetical protein